MEGGRPGVGAVLAARSEASCCCSGHSGSIAGRESGCLICPSFLGLLQPFRCQHPECRDVVTLTHPDATAKLQTRSPCPQSSSPLSGQLHLFCIGTGGCFFNMEKKYIIFKDRLQFECPGLGGRQNSSQGGKEREVRSFGMPPLP